jgi:hypothetical protein
MSVRSLLSAVKVLTGLNPKLSGNSKDLRRFIPEGYKAVCLISVDFEQAWAYLHSKKSKANATLFGIQTRSNIPKILDLCDKFNVPVTWATVGHLFLDSCTAENGLKHGNLERIPHFENEFWKFQEGDWFDNDPCTDFQTNPEFYGSNLINEILKRKVKHEIACHTFSHIDCSDKRCPAEVFQDEITECLSLAKSKGIEMKSFVHPGHEIGHLNELFELGFESYRTNFGDTLGIPEKHKSGLWELKNSAELAYRKNWSEKLNTYKFVQIMNRAVKYRKVIVFWFHPIMDSLTLDKVIEPVFRYLDEHRRDIWITTHKEYTNYLNSKA